jgi:hypothetical protein
MTFPRMIPARTLQRATLAPGAGEAPARGRPLPAEIRRLAEEVFGVDLSDVRVHVGAGARQIGARAFTSGADVYFAPDQYDPGSERGLRLLGHEIAHVVQQRRGQARNPYGHGVAIVRDPALEAEADRMGEALAARARRPAHRVNPAVSTRAAVASGALQRATAPEAQIGVGMTRSGEVVATEGGRWTAREYWAKPGVNDLTARGAHMLLEFTPNQLVNATLIALVQTVQVIKNGELYYLNATVEARSVDGASIDQSAESRSPLYAANPDKGGKSLGAAPPEPKAGAYGYHYSTFGFASHKPASLQDNPHLRGVESASSQIFETTALAVDGVDKGRYYGSVSWGWTWDQAGGLEIIPLKVTANDWATPMFAACAERWNVTLTSRGEAPLKLPEVVDPQLSWMPRPDPRVGKPFDAIGEDDL